MNNAIIIRHNTEVCKQSIVELKLQLTKVVPDQNMFTIVTKSETKTVTEF